MYKYKAKRDHQVQSHPTVSRGVTNRHACRCCRYHRPDNATDASLHQPLGGAHAAVMKECPEPLQAWSAAAAGNATPHAGTQWPRGDISQPLTPLSSIPYGQSPAVGGDVKDAVIQGQLKVTRLPFSDAANRLNQPKGGEQGAFQAEGVTFSGRLPEDGKLRTPIPGVLRTPPFFLFSLAAFRGGTEMQMLISR